ncbi:hypothetical protein [Aliikangiella maris]|uniref:Uncharacterized protein n=2 Tax=Aliikangiella maris TaxID=3162458 RepID=A0ABV2BVR1_9GAMM
MAIIQCPSCKDKISDKATVCNHCHFNLVTGQTAQGESQEQIASKAKLAHLKRRYSLQMQAMSGLIVFLGAIIIWYFVGERGMTEPSHFIQLSIAFLGAIWYLLTRIRIILFKKN